MIGVDGRRIAAFAVADISMVLRREREEEEVVLLDCTGSDRGVGWPLEAFSNACRTHLEFERRIPKNKDRCGGHYY